MIVALFIHSYTCAYAKDDMDFVIPTYSEFLKKFPSGYPEFKEKGNPKSIGAFKLYLESLGLYTIDNSGNSIGFKLILEESKRTTNTKKPSNNGKNNNSLNMNSLYLPFKESNLFDNKSINQFSTLATRKILCLNHLNSNKNSIINWAQTIHSTLNNNLIYPLKAQKRKLSGRVVIKISLKNNGDLVTVSISSSSQHKILDKSVIDSVKNLIKFPTGPFKESDYIYSFILPVDFVLRN